MKKSFLSVFTATLLSVFALSGCGSEDIKIGTAGENSKYMEVGKVIKSNLERTGDFKVAVLSSAGSAANVRNINTGDIQLALAQNDVSNDAYHAVGAFKGGFRLDDFAAVGALYAEACHIVVREESNIHHINELLGKKVSIGELHSGTEQNAKQILSAYGIAGYNTESVNLNYQAATESLKNGDIDAMFVTAGVGMPLLVKLAEETPIRFLSVDDHEAGEVIDNYGFYTKTVIPPGSYKGQIMPVQTVGIKTLLIASRRLSSDSVQSITENLFSHATTFRGIIPVTEELNEKNAVDGVSIPFHSGAARYYRTKNIRVRTE